MGTKWEGTEQGFFDWKGEKQLLRWLPEMRMKELELLFWNYIRSDAYVGDTQETKRAMDRVYQAIQEQQYEKVEELLTVVAIENEKQGFVQGFRYAVHLFLSNL